MLRKNGTALKCKCGEAVPVFSSSYNNWPRYRFYDLPDGPSGISFFIAASAAGVSGTTGSFAAAVLPLEPPSPPDPKNRIAVSASPSIAPPPRRSRDRKRELSASL